MGHGRHSFRIKVIAMTLVAVFGAVALCLALNNTLLVKYYEKSKQETLGTVYEEIDRLTKEKPFGYEEEVRCNVFKLFLNFHRSLRSDAAERVVLSSKHQKIYEIVEYISGNMGEIDSLDSLCAQFFISKYYLCHSFKEVTGMSVMAFLNMTRVLRAVVLLGEDNMTIAQIAKAVGFGTVARMTDVFKRIEDITPHEYRRRLKQKGEK